MIVQSFFRFPLFRVPDTIVQRILLGQPATQATKTRQGEVLDRLENLYYLIALSRRWADPDYRKDHAISFAKTMPLFASSLESERNITVIR
jgi:hypothetical protein